MEQFLQQLLNGLAVGGIYALVALGYTMVYGVLKLINFAHGDLFTIGAYLGLTLLVSCNMAGALNPFLAVAAVFIMVALLVALNECGRSTSPTTALQSQTPCGAVSYRQTRILLPTPADT